MVHQIFVDLYWKKVTVCHSMCMVRCDEMSCGKFMGDVLLICVGCDSGGGETVAKWTYCDVALSFPAI